MPLSDEQLFDFDTSLLADWDEAKAHANLKKYGDAYRYQLQAAIHLDGWAERAEKPVPPQSEDAFARALREVAAHLRQGDYLPGGAYYQLVEGK